MRHPYVPCLLALAALAAPAVAAAATPAPSNDARNAAQALGALPASVTGTTVGATTEGVAEPPQRCGPGTGSVWYALTPSANGRLAVSAQAAGDLDLVIDVVQRVRSQNVPVACDASDERGAAATDFVARTGTTYLIRVSQRVTSVAGTFTLRVSAPAAPAAAPGPALPRAGVTRSVARVANPDDAWSFVMRQGHTYRIHLSGRGGRCEPDATLLAPGGRGGAFGPAVRGLRCGDYALYTPAAGEGGRYSVLVRASARARTAQRYHLQVAEARRDDSAPALAVANHRRVRGSLQGGRIDVVDLYRFEVTSRSVTFLDLAGREGFALTLFDDHGRRLATGGRAIHRGTKPGRYFVAVRALGNATGRYTLTRSTRVITRTAVTLTGSPAGLRATASTTPAVGGAYELTFERFDPIAGWLFATRVRTRGAAGSASATWTPPGVGRYRAHATFLGTRDAAASHSVAASLRVG